MIASILILTLSAAVDCERSVQGLGQPANAASSFAYVFVGAVIAAASRRQRAWRMRSLVMAACLIAVGLGSVAFHGPSPDGTQLLHDLPIALLLGLMILHDINLVVPRFDYVLASLFGCGLVITGVALWVPGAASGIAAVLVPVLVLSEAVVYRRGLRPQPVRLQRRLLLALSLMVAVAGVLWVLGRNESPACVPGSVLQLHAVWHVTSALLFGIWWWLALADGTTREAPRSGTGAGSR